MCGHASIQYFKFGQMSRIGALHVHDQAAYMKICQISMSITCTEDSPYAYCVNSTDQNMDNPVPSSDTARQTSLTPSRRGEIGNWQGQLTLLQFIMLAMSKISQ